MSFPVSLYAAILKKISFLKLCVYGLFLKCSVVINITQALSTVLLAAKLVVFL